MKQLKQQFFLTDEQQSLQDVNKRLKNNQLLAATRSSGNARPEAIFVGSADG